MKIGFIIASIVYRCEYLIEVIRFNNVLHLLRGARLQKCNPSIGIINLIGANLKLTRQTIP